MSLGINQFEEHDSLSTEFIDDRPMTEQEISNFMSLVLLLIILFPEDFAEN